MSGPAKKILPVVLGLVLGIVGGIMLGLCLLIFVILVCVADGGGLDMESRHKWVNTTANVAAWGIIVLAPLAGAVIGVMWARRRNRRDGTNTT